VDGCEGQILFILELVLQCGSVASRRLGLFVSGECPSHTVTRDNPSSWFTLSDWKSIVFLLSYEPNYVPGFSGQDVSVDG